MNLPGKREDPWQALRQRTTARVAIGRAGTSLPTAEILKFAMDHAEARDAVLSEPDFDRVEAELGALKQPVIRVQSAANDRADYIRFPDRGRRLSEVDRQRLQAGALANADLVIAIGDGLSAAALQHAPLLIRLLMEELARPPVITISPVVLVKHARVAIEDDIGETLRGRAALILLGERPGLGAADSLGAYLVYAPKVGRTDADRNCVSNIRPAGLPLPVAARTIDYLIRQALQRQISGVALKDDRTPNASLPSP